MQEIVEMRNLNSKHHYLGGNQYKMEAHTGHINYKDGSEYERIDTTLEKCKEGWIQTKASYDLVLPKYANGRIVFHDKFESNREIIYVPICKKVEGYLIECRNNVVEKTVRYPNAFGDGIHLECSAGNLSFRKDIVIEQKQSNDVAVEFEIEIPSSENLIIKGQYKNPKQSIDLQGYNIKIGSEYDNGASHIRKAIVYDSDGLVSNIPFEYRFENSKSYLKKIIPASFLKKAMYPVRSDTVTSYYTLVGDGEVKSTSASWNTAHDAAAGDIADYASQGPRVSIEGSGGTNARIYRAYLPVDTSSLSGSATINSATLNIYVTVVTDVYNDAQGYIAVVKTFQPSYTVLNTGDYNDCGYDVGNEVAGRAQYLAVKGSSDYDLTGMATSAYLVMTLNATGRGWIVKGGTTPLGIREGHDVEDVNPGMVFGDESRVIFNSSEASNDPYLSVDYDDVPSALSTQGWANLADKYLSGNLM